MTTGILLFPADWRRQIVKIVLELELELSRLLRNLALEQKVHNLAFGESASQ